MLVVFDVDGTLVDSQGAIHAAMARAFAAVGREAPARRSVAKLVGLSLPRMVEALMPDADVPTWDRAVAEYRLAFPAIVAAEGEAPLYPGAAAALDALERRGVALGIATGKSKRGLDRLLAERGWAGRFATTQCADHHPSKPHPSMLRRALLETATEAGDAAMVGDTSFDMEMARAAGVRALGVDWGYHAPDVLMRAGAAEVLSSFDALVERLT